MSIMSDIPTTVSPQACEGVICFEDIFGCVEVHIGASTHKNRIEMPSPTSRSLCADTSLLWGEDRPITVSFLDSCDVSSFSDEQVKGFVKNGAYDWTSGTSLNFNFLDAHDVDRDRADIRISFQGGESYSVVGTTFVKHGKPTMNLGFKRNINRAKIEHVVRHEFGHALGFHHEHSSPNCSLRFDPEAIMRYFQNESLAGTFLHSWVNDNFAKLAMGGAIEASHFDKHSIMVYTILREWNEERVSITGSMVLSETDREMVRKWYPPRPIQQIPTQIQSHPSEEDTRLSMNSSQLMSLTHNEGLNLVYNFRCDRPECQERQCDTCFQYTYYLKKRAEGHEESNERVLKVSSFLS